MFSITDKNGKEKCKLNKGDVFVFPTVQENKELYPFFGFFNIGTYEERKEQKTNNKDEVNKKQENDLHKNQLIDAFQNQGNYNDDEGSEMDENIFISEESDCLLNQDKQEMKTDIDDEKIFPALQEEENIEKIKIENISDIILEDNTDDDFQEEIGDFKYTNTNNINYIDDDTDDFVKRTYLEEMQMTNEEIEEIKDFVRNNYSNENDEKITSNLSDNDELDFDDGVPRLDKVDEMDPEELEIENIFSDYQLYRYYCELEVLDENKEKYKQELLKKLKSVGIFSKNKNELEERLERKYELTPKLDFSNNSLPKRFQEYFNEDEKVKKNIDDKKDKDIVSNHDEEDEYADCYI